MQQVGEEILGTEVMGEVQSRLQGDE
jgi:hypothetical protein